MLRITKIFFIVVAMLVSLTSCSSLPEYQERQVDETYFRQENPIAELSVKYPEFEDEAYKSLNEVILSEVENCRSLYEELCQYAAEDIDNNKDSITFQRCVKATYEIKSCENSLSVTFKVEWLTGSSNSEQSYTKTFTLDLVSGMLYETYTETKRVY